MSRAADVLNNDVDRYPGLAERLEDRGRHAWPVGNTEHRDLGDVGFLCDPAHSLSFFHWYLGDDHRTHAVVKARSDVDGNAVELADLDRARVHHAGAHRRQLEHLVVTDVGQLSRVPHDLWIRGEDAIDIGVDLA